MQSSQTEIPTGAKVFFWAIVGLVVLMLFMWLKPWTSVNAGHKGVVLRGGKAVRLLDEGYQYKTPAIEDVEEVDVRTQVETVEATAASKDLQTVSTKVAVNYNVLPNKVLEMWNGVGKSYKSIIIDPAIQEAVKSATAKHTAEELITKRQAVKDEITSELKARLAESGFLALTQVSITDFDFSSSFNAAIEAKVTAEQKAKEAENKLKQVEAEAKQKVANAQAEAEAIRLQGNAANSENYIRLKELEVQLEYAKRSNGTMPQTLIIGSGSTPLPFINLGGGR